MENKNESNSFSFSYTAPTEEERRQIESIRRQYVISPSDAQSKTDRLKKLHERVHSTPRIISLTLGVVGLLIFGLGLAMVLEWQLIFAGVLIAAVGACPIAAAYPVYSLLLAKNKKKHGEEIVRLSNELLGEAMPEEEG